MLLGKRLHSNDLDVQRSFGKTMNLRADVFKAISLKITMKSVGKYTHFNFTQTLLRKYFM